MEVRQIGCFGRTWKCPRKLIARLNCPPKLSYMDLSMVNPENLKIASGKFHLGIIINDKTEGMILAYLCIHIYVNIT